MDGIAAKRASQAADQGSPRAAGIFLHAGWRSCGTWMWERLRDGDNVRAFYEPLHEDLARLRVRDVGLLRPDSWPSGHGIGAPYFAEYLPLLSAAGGVHGYAARFAFDDFFRPPEQDDPALECYLRGLIANAGEENRLPVMKFCRSLGRVPWLEARFPDMLHVVILRNPLAQWRSARRQMEQNGNRYFVVAPFVILARNASHPLLADAAERLGVKCPPGLGLGLTRDLSVTTDACWRHVSRIGWQDRFRAFLALWLASGIISVQGTATLLDADRLSDEPLLRGAAETALGQAVGITLDLMPGTTGAVQTTAGAEPESMDGAAALQAALSFLREHAGTMSSDRAAILASKLQTNPPVTEAPTTTRALHPGTLAYIDAAAYVAMMRASYPLRRARFHIRKWFGGDTEADH
jgi:hypothetical protein